MRRIRQLTIAASACVAVVACGSDSTAPDATRRFYLYTWQGNGTYLMGDGVLYFGNYIRIDSGALNLAANGGADESIWYHYAVPSNAAILSATEHFVGRWVTVDANQEVHLPEPGDPDALVGYVQPDQSVPVFRTWIRDGASFGGNFLYLKR